MKLSTLLIERSDRIATVTINRPEKLNALNAECKRELREVFTQLRSDRDVDVVIVTGAGEKAFVAGTDIGELHQLDRMSGEEFATAGQNLFTLIEHLGKPVIAAVNGLALGGGCELAMACHIRIASERARFGQPEVGLGVIPGYGGTQRLPRLVGLGKAIELVLTGNHIDAREAMSLGLVNRVVPQTELIPEAKATAKTIIGKGPLAVRQALQAMLSTLEYPLTRGLTIEAALFGESCGTPEAKEGITAFLEKRPPSFRST